MGSFGKRVLPLAVALTTVFSGTGAFASVVQFKPFLPDSMANRLRLDLRTKRKSKMTEAQFNKVVKDTTDSYTALAKEHGAKLVVSADWTDDTVNAYADEDGKNWNVHFFVGLARQPTMT